MKMSKINFDLIEKVREKKKIQFPYKVFFFFKKEEFGKRTLEGQHQAASKWAPNLREQLIWFPKFSNFQLLKAFFPFARIRRHLFFLSVSVHKP
jgi:hypothetical protein